MKISIIIVNYKTPDSLKKLLKTLDPTNHQVIVIDNSDKNIGYAAGCNKGVIQSECEWLLFLNPDIEINQKQIETLVRYAIENNLDACSPKTTEDYQKPLPTWFSLLVEFTPLNKIVPFKLFKNKTLFGGCLLIKKEVLKALGGWDERFFLWFEDSDLTKGLIENHYKVGWTDLKISHRGGESLKKLEGQMQRDIFFHCMDVYAKKYFSFFGQLLVSRIKKRFSKRKVLPEILSGVSIVVPNLKYDLLMNFLNKNSKEMVNIDELIVVSSSLTPGVVWDLRRRYPEIRFIPIEKNDGFASTVNIGFRVCRGKWLGTVNDDVVLNNYWLDQCLKYATNKSGSINPVIYKESGDIESAGIKLLDKGKAEAIKQLDKNIRFEKVDATNAAAVLYPKEILNKIGLFDKKFGSYLEDIDLSLRISHAGFENIVVTKASVTHVGHQTANNLGVKKPWLDFRNWIYVILKNWGMRKIIFNFPSIILERLRNLFGIIKAL